MRIERCLLLPAFVAFVAGTANPAAAQFDGRWRTDFSKHTVPLDEIVSGGPPKDGIPAIDRPDFVTVQQADGWLDDREPVAVVSIGAEVKAYPLQILIWHEIVNDVVDGVPVAVTFCPLCNTTLSFDRRLDGHLLDFGTTGRLRHSDLVMYDRQTESWWQQATGEGIVGEYAGRQLTFIASPLVNWETFKRRFPAGRVLSRKTGHRRSYGRNPYAGYDSPTGRPMSLFFQAEVDERLPAMERVVAVTVGGETAAYPFSALARARVTNDQLGGVPVVVWWAPGTASALDASRIADGRDVGSSAVFDRRVGSRVLSFESVGDGRFRDHQTGSTWDALGRAIDGDLLGTQLDAIPHGNHFWFAWAVFMPETRIVR